MRESPYPSSAGSSAEDLASVFAVLSDPTRIQMLRLLVASPEVACTTFEALFPISKSTISYHVKALRYAGLIRVRKDGKYYHYTLLRDELEHRLPGLTALLSSVAQVGTDTEPGTHRTAPEPAAA